MNKHLNYNEVITKTGMWLHSIDTNFLFSFIPNTYTKKEKQDTINCFKENLKTLLLIQNKTIDIIGRDSVADSLYFVNKDQIIKTMISIPGMGMTSVLTSDKEVSGTAASINLNLFKNILSETGGEVDVLNEFLIKSMGKLQFLSKKSTEKEYNGMIVGVVSLMPILGIPVVTFKYIYTASDTKEHFQTMSCEDEKKYIFDEEYMQVIYNLIAPDMNQFNF